MKSKIFVEISDTAATNSNAKPYTAYIWLHVDPKKHWQDPHKVVQAVGRSFDDCIYNLEIAIKRAIEQYGSVDG